MKNAFLLLFRFLLPALLLFLFRPVVGQDLSGLWKGTLAQEGRPGVFSYELILRQEGDLISGTSISVAPDGKSSARFVLTGIWDGKKLVLQEIEQTEPKAPRWCLKYISLELSPESDRLHLRGDWKADGCTPGKLDLAHNDVHFEVTTVEEEIPFSIEGKWTGALSQSDRDHGFYFDCLLEPGNQGRSYIVSEDNGGDAHHALQWSFDSTLNLLEIQESRVAERSDPQWKWCIKTAQLQLRRESGRFVLEGEWSGYIEGKDPETGACAPGKIYLEKPVLTRQVAREVARQSESYKQESQREIKVERILEVKSKKLLLKVWDNGAVDGDVCTIFLNGKRLVHQLQVTKRKVPIPVTLNEENNFLILHADDLGDIQPNTVAVSIDDGLQEQVIILSSNLRESGAVIVKEFRINNN